MGFSTQKGTQTTFFDGQEDLVGQLIKGPLTSKTLGGSPDFTSQFRTARAREGVTRDAAAAGFSESDPVTQQRRSEVDQAGVTSEEAAFMQSIGQLWTGSGQAGGGGFSMGLKGK